ncbi:MAG TPA: hypothetical protein EYG16_03745 [Deltaproteobacteria bacterium]|nr:hypothetical protein [Deltaproteobacteria bacterium]
MTRQKGTRFEFLRTVLPAVVLLLQSGSVFAAGLTYIEKETGADPNVTPTMDAGAVTPDGQFVVTVGGNSVFAYRRDSSTGELDCEQEFGLVDQAIDHALSPDGEHLYVSVNLLGSNNGQIRWFAVSSAPGAGSCDPVFVMSPTPLGTVTQGAGIFSSLDAPKKMSVSPDGNTFVSVSGGKHAIHVFSRDNDSGSPSFGDISLLENELLSPGVGTGPTVTGLKEPRNAVFSADSAHLYAIGEFILADGSSTIFAVGHWSRNKDGELDFKGHLREGEPSAAGTVDGLSNARDLLVDPDPSGNTLHVTGTADDFTSAVAHLERDPLTGALSFLGVTDGLNGSAAEGITATCLSNVHVSMNGDFPPLTTLHALGGGILGSPEPDVGPIGSVVGSVGWLASSPDSLHVYGGSGTNSGVLVFAQGSGCGDGIVGVGEDCDPCPPASAAGTGSCCSVVDCSLTIGAACSDETFCNGTEVCDATGSCVTSGSDPCVDTCNSICEDLGNSCQPDPVDTPCDDGAFCNGDDACDGAGTCAGAGDPCTAGGDCNDVCDEALDSCLVPAGTSCASDGLFCNGGELCDAAGNCLDHSEDPCTNAPECAQQCDETKNACVPSSTGTPCSDDGSFCTGVETCDGEGTCAGAGNPCSELCVGNCDEATEACLFDDAGTDCYLDMNPCDGLEHCDGAGNCELDPLEVTYDDDPCVDCLFTVVENEFGDEAYLLELAPTDAGTLCNDGLFCNGPDGCDGSGTCVAAGLDPCTSSAVLLECNNVCDEDADSCLVPAGTSCSSDGVFCNGVETCDGAGSCSDHSGDPCTIGPECAQQCNETTATCVPDSKGTPCSDDGYPCTVDACNGNGKCKGKTKPAKGNVCRPVASGCDVAEVCEGKKFCPADEFLPAGTPCSADADACTDQLCDGGPDCTYPPTVCDDSNPCLTPTCDSVTGCGGDPLPDGTPCDDGKSCTLGDTCSSGTCTGSPLVDTDSDGYCDELELALGCDHQDFTEIPWPDSPESPTLVFRGSGPAKEGNTLVTWDGPSRKAMKLDFKDELGCLAAGVCDTDWGFCVQGLRADPCTVDTDCNRPELSCRLVARWRPATTFDVFSAVLKGSKPFGKQDITSEFQPITRGCARKLDIDMPASRRLTVKARSEALGLKDIDRFKFLVPK